MIARHNYILFVSACFLYLLLWLTPTANNFELGLESGTDATERIQPIVLPSRTQGWKTISVYIGPEKEDEYNSFLSYSQISQDLIINSMFDPKGFFVDLAANHYKVISNTYSLETFPGWNGICIEPNSQYWEGHLKRRCTVVSAVVSEVKNEVINFVTSKGASGGIIAKDTDNRNVKVGPGVKKFYTVDIVEIFKMFSVPEIIQYISLDVEGAEERIFQSFPFESYAVYAMTVERPTEKILAILKEQQFVEVGILSYIGESVYLNKKTPNFMKILRQGQIQITKIERKLDTVTEKDIVPVKNKMGWASGVRCPYYKAALCQRDLVHYSVKYKKIMERWS